MIEGVIYFRKSYVLNTDDPRLFYTDEEDEMADVNTYRYVRLMTNTFFLNIIRRYFNVDYNCPFITIFHISRSKH